MGTPSWSLVAKPPTGVVMSCHGSSISVWAAPGAGVSVCGTIGARCSAASTPTAVSSIRSAVGVKTTWLGPARREWLGPPVSGTSPAGETSSPMCWGGNVTTTCAPGPVRWSAVGSPGRSS